MRLILFNFDGILGLRGTIAFPPGKPTILYGSNIAGKSNVITAIRLCFLRHKIFRERELRLDEIALKPLRNVSMSCYFSQANKIHRVVYRFRRRGASVSENRYLYSASTVPVDWDLGPNELLSYLEGLDWGGPRSTGVDEIKELLERERIFPDVVDLLLASSNVDNYLKALEGEVCEIPRALSEQLTQIREEAKKNQKRMDKVESKVLSRREKAEEYLEAQKRYLRKVFPIDEIRKLSVDRVSDVKKKLDKYGEKISRRLSEGIPKEIENAIKAKGELKNYKDELKVVEDTRSVLEEEKNYKETLEKLSRLRNSSEKWREIEGSVDRLPSKAWNMDEYDPPKIEGFDFLVFKEHRAVDDFFGRISDCKDHIERCKKLCEGLDVETEKDLRQELDSREDLLKSLTNPMEPPEDAVEALISRPPPKRKLWIVSVPIDKYNEEVARVNRTTRVYTRKEMSKEDREKVEERIKELKGETRKLRDSSELLEKAKKLFEIINQEKPIVDEKEEELVNEIKELEKKLTDIKDGWVRNASILWNRFKLGKMELKFTDETFKQDISKLKRKVLECFKKLVEKIVGILESFPKHQKEIKKELSTEKLTQVISTLEKQTKKLEKERRKLERVQKWLQKERENIINESKAMVFSDFFRKKVMPYIKVFYQAVYDSINLEQMVDSLGDLMQENVRVSYRNIIPDETLTFEHIGGGKFWSKLNDQPISQPSGSQRAAISFGVMVTLAKQFGLPLIMDEAADRFDVDRLANFLDLARRVATDIKGGGGLQICLALYRTRDVNSEDLASANSYEIQKKSNTEKIIRPYKSNLTIV